MNDSEVTEVLDHPLAREMMQSPLIARLAYVGIDGGPRVVPVGYLWNGRTFVVCTATMAPKVRSLRANPNVALTIDTDSGTQPPNILLVRGTAVVDIVDGVPDEFLEASRKVIAADAWSGFEANSRALYPQMARITIQPTWAKLIDFETTFPSAVAELVNAQS